MFAEALSFLVRNLVSFLILNLLLRFYLQLARAPFGHPLAQFTVKLTNFAVLPLRKWVGSIGGYDTATLLLAWLSALLMHFVLLLLSPWPINLLTPVAAIGLVMLSLVELMRLSLYLLFATVLVQAVLSWVSPYNPLSPMLDAISRPFLSPLRKLIPTIGGIDLSPMVLLLILQMMLQFALAPIEQGVFQYIVIA
ncbi:YggT family protein [Chitinimonas sp. BJB300]|uniref:YggT family protein n=1 Tax=Chitinimonas sp. BJB300 TaxID=1559339 RepID=UPI000C0D9058|nr:YggT family protein [Chitinimonas sp. BJB300]PHV13205.1 osmotic-shock protein [Chitinimonas sp. BJB300]TSJ89596.1 YggT family protein [Chitinimonas sp. BJB300]